MKEIELTPLKRVGNDFFITKPRSFSPTTFTNKNDVMDTFEFAWSMTFGADGAHRDHRSGGTSRRKNGEIFANTYQGKLAEFAITNEFFGFAGVERPDLSVYGLGKWDSFDVYLNSFHIAVKSTKSYGNLLLLETKDWSVEANYSNNSQNQSPDFLCLVRLQPDVDMILKQARLLYSNTCDKSILEKLITNQNFTYDCCGFISKSDLKNVIKEKFILPQHAMLNGKTRMDAENYYVQAGDLLPLDRIPEFKSISPR
jgi:hypothetical protein